MVVNTRIFGEVDIAEDRIITMPGGIIGFPDLQKFVLMYNNEKSDGRIGWFVSLDEPSFALPVMDPLIVDEVYNPMVEDELLNPIGGYIENDMLILVTITIPKGNLEGMTANLKAPIIINANTRKGTQIILEDDRYWIKTPAYEKIKAIKES